LLRQVSNLRLQRYVGLGRWDVPTVADKVLRWLPLS